MAGKMKQAARIATLSTPAGADVLVLTQMQASEGLSELFEVSVEALSETEDFDFNQLIGQACTVTLENIHGAKRYFNGILTAAEWHGEAEAAHRYRLTLRPWLWLLGKTSDCRIFHKKPVPDIMRKVFSDRGFQAFRFATTQTYPPMDYCVQYRETDLNFVQRLMEQFGIYYFFEHADGRHTLVLADAKSSHKPVEQLATLQYEPQNPNERHQRQSVSFWVSGRRFRSGKVALNDYNFETPTANLLAQKPMPEGHTHDAMESYDYPGRFPVLAEGEDLARARVEAERATDRRRSGSGVAGSLVPGGLVKLEGHPRGSENVEYLVVRCRHTFRTESYRSGAASDERPYSGSYEFLPSDRRFRPPVVTPKPIVYGPQTAVVTGKKGEEIDVDKYGRILVRFHWDREKGQSCRVRVAQIWSGNKWGGQVIPRIGQEVVVEFLEGDPDRPLVTGTVYNADNMPPYELPDKMTLAGVKSNSTKGGGGYNEFVFDDKKNSELIRMHGEKDHEVVIRNSQSVEIGEVFVPPMGSPSRKHVIKSGDDSLTVAAGNQDVTIAQKQDLKIGMMRQTTVGISDTLTVGASLATTAGASVSTTAGATVSVTAGAGIQLTAGANVSITGATITLTGVVKITGALILTGPPIISPV
jgi:type VI secretion system secreted protein VgrG